jgi:hypothetical protein
MAKAKIPTSVHGLVTVWSDNGLIQTGVGFPPIVGLDDQVSLGVYSQTANTSAGNVANQAVGTVQIASGTTDGANVTITNARITANSFIFLTIKGDGGKKIFLDKVVPTTGSATFRVQTSDAAATTANCDVWFQIWN